MHAADAELLGQPRGMDRRGAAEGDHGAVLQLLAALDGMDAGGVRHVLLDDLADAERGVEAGEAKRLADRLVDGDARLLGRELDAAAGEVAGIEPAQHDVGVGHGRLGAAAAVARRAGLGAGALGADIDAARANRPRRSSRRRRRSRPSRSPGCAAAGRCPSGSGTGARPRRCANAAARRCRSGRSWRSCRPCRTTAPCRGRTGAPAPRPGSRRRPGPNSTRRIGNLRAVSSAARPPPEVIMNSGQATPSLRSASSSRPR